jgi:hypothetical protein
MNEENEKSRFLQVLPALIVLALFGAGIVLWKSQASAKAATHHNATVLASKAQSGVFMNGTLATLGSFEWDAAPLTNKAADVLVAIPLQLKKHEITKAQAQAKLDAADRAHDLIASALTTCNQNPQTGKCRGSDSKARLLLDQAKAQLAGL